MRSTAFRRRQIERRKTAAAARRPTSADLLKRIRRKWQVCHRFASPYRVAEMSPEMKSDPTLEWLETDGLGGFASGTVPGVRTRRYHALLLVATTPPTGRFVLVN